MADIYVRPYGEKSKNPLRFMLPVLVVAALVGGAIWWWMERSTAPQEEPVVEKSVPTPVVQPAKTKTASKPAVQRSIPSVAPTMDVQRTFSRAQSQIAAGKLTEASALLNEVIAKSSDESLKSNALRMQGRVNLQLFLSEVPMAEKKSYVIQPGDSLDRIARRNNTTVDLIRRMNKIEGTLIYPGARLMVPAAPFIVEVDKSDRQLELILNGKLFKRYAVGVGRYGKTPLGTFMTVVHQTQPDWTPPSGGIIPFGDPRNVLGTRWISIQDDTRPEIKGFGIHGTSDRESIGGETSNGCIRMLNEDVEEVFLLIPRGTKVVINE